MHLRKFCFHFVVFSVEAPSRLPLDASYDRFFKMRRFLGTKTVVANVFDYSVAIR